MLLAKVKNTLGKSGLFSVAVLYASAIVVGNVLLFQPAPANAAQLTSRSLTMSSSANGNISTDAAGNATAAGSGGNGAKAQHTAKFTMATSAATVGSIALIYCDSPIFQTSCTSGTATTGNEQNLTSATATGTGLGGTGWALDTTTTNATVTTALAGYGTCNGSGTTRSNCVLLKASSAGANTGTPAITVQYGGGASNYVVNPTNDNQTFYVRVVVFGTTSYGTVVDNGAMANSTAQQVDITAKVQETLNFSVGTTVTAPSTNCAAFSDTGALALGDTNGVLNFTSAYAKNSYFRVSTNATSGTLVYYSGDTLKSGSNTITSIGNSAGGTSSSPGSSQFGLAIDSSDTQSGSGYSFTSLAANNGSNIAGHAYDYSAGNGTITNAGTAKFQFDTGSTTSPDPIAKATGIIACDTGSVRYLGNISANTPAGIYTTTITYLAVPTY